MSGDWKQNKEWSDKYLSIVKKILGYHFIIESDEKTDQEENTDLIMLTLKPYRFAVRVRKEEYLEKYGNEFTIRAELPSGKETELQKLLSGLGDYMFYGFVNDTNIIAYVIINLTIFRRHIVKFMNLNKGNIPGIFKRNSDGSAFYAFEYKEFPKEMIEGSKNLIIGDL